jgi:hypothetical protein
MDKTYITADGVTVKPGDRVYIVGPLSYQIAADCVADRFAWNERIPLSDSWWHTTESVFSSRDAAVKSACAQARESMRHAIHAIRRAKFDLASTKRAIALMQGKFPLDKAAAMDLAGVVAGKGAAE